MQLHILDCGSCEGFKAGVHGAALALATIMGAYNAAAWIRRRQRHLAINAVIYGTAIFWERRHVAHHWTARPSKLAREAASILPFDRHAA